MKLVQLEREKIDACRDNLNFAIEDSGRGVKSRRRQSIETIYKEIGLPVPSTLSGTVGDLSELQLVIADLHFQNINKQKDLEEKMKRLKGNRGSSGFWV